MIMYFLAITIALLFVTGFLIVMYKVTDIFLTKYNEKWYNYLMRKKNRGKK